MKNLIGYRQDLCKVTASLTTVGAFIFKQRTKKYRKESKYFFKASKEVLENFRETFSKLNRFHDKTKLINY